MAWPINGGIVRPSTNRQWCEECEQETEHFQDNCQVCVNYTLTQIREDFLTIQKTIANISHQQTKAKLKHLLYELRKTDMGLMMQTLAGQEVVRDVTNKLLREERGKNHGNNQTN